jgi:hypothetical protein
LYSDFYDCPISFAVLLFYLCCLKRNLKNKNGYPTGRERGYFKMVANSTGGGDGQVGYGQLPRSKSFWGIIPAQSFSFFSYGWSQPLYRIKYLHPNAKDIGNKC